jgi:signal transduction histidine kinase
LRRDALDPHLLVRRLADDVLHRLTADAVLVWLHGGDGTELELVHAEGLQDARSALELAHRPSSRLADWLLSRRLPAAVTLRPRELTGDRAWLAAEGAHSLLAVPVIAAGTPPLGILAAFRRRRPFPVGCLARAAALAGAAAPALHAAQRLDEMRRRAERAETLLAVTRILGVATDLDVALEDVGRRTASALGAVRCAVRLGITPAPRTAAGSELVVPIARQQDVIGTLTLDGPPRGGWIPEAVDLATAIAAQIALAADHARLAAGTARPAEGETLRALADLAAGAAHHLNNLLTIVVGRVQLVLRSAPDPAISRPLAIVEQAARDGAEVVRRLQQFSRIGPVIHPRPVDLDAVVRDVLAADVAGRRDGAPIAVEARYGEVPPVSGDAAALREALANIVQNAVDAMPDGGRLVAVTDVTDAAVLVAVSDTGAGMTDDVQRRAAEPFFTTKGVKATGLGLSVAYGIVRSHGGDVAIRSAAGVGTTVTVTLPRAGACPT